MAKTAMLFAAAALLIPTGDARAAEVEVKLLNEGPTAPRWSSSPLS
ncbi:hypothetical protein ACFXS9_13525 [Bradyrhizobium sp. RDI18]